MGNRRTAAHRKLLDSQTPEAAYGPVLGILATSYELDPSFVEVDLLPSLFGLGAWDDRSWASRVALEKALAEVDAATILVDQRKYRGRPRSPRIEVLPAVGAHGQLLHAKVLLVVYEHAVRFQVSSANLTEAGYRENREVALPFVATEETPATAAVVLQAVQAMPETLAAWWTESAGHVQMLALQQLRKWAGTPHESTAIVWGGQQVALWQQVIDRWPHGQPIERISIVSPFWSEDGPNGPFTKLLGELRRRRVLTSGAAIDLYTEVDAIRLNVFRPKVPPLGPVDPGAFDVKMRAWAVDPLPSDEPGGRDVVRQRKLHAKVFILHGHSTTLTYVGSGNFTVPGWGFTSAPEAANVEAGVILLRQGSALADELLPPTTGEPVVIGPALSVPVPTDEDHDAVVPTFLRGVWLNPDPERPDTLRLSILVDLRRVRGPYSVSFGGDEPEVLLSADSQPAAENHITLGPNAVSRLLRDQQVKVCWWESSEPKDFPVNVALNARDQLPVVQGCPNPNEKLLLAYYQGRISLTDLFPPPPGENGPHPQAPPMESGVDTSKIQSYQVREFVEALAGIREDLAAARKGTKAAMRLAVLGPVSPLALARQVTEAWRRGERSATATGFELIEISCCLTEASGSNPSDGYWNDLLAEGRRAIQTLFDEVRAKAPLELGKGTDFVRYAREVLAGNPTRGVSAC